MPATQSSSFGFPTPAVGGVDVALGNTCNPVLPCLAPHVRLCDCQSCGALLSMDASGDLSSAFDIAWAGATQRGASPARARDTWHRVALWLCLVFTVFVCWRVDVCSGTPLRGRPST